MSLFPQVLNIIFISSLFLLLSPTSVTSFVGTSPDALKPWLGIAFVFSASHLTLQIAKQVWVFFRYRRQVRVEEVEEEVLSEEEEPKHKREYGQDAMDLLDT